MPLEEKCGMMNSNAFFVAVVSLHKGYGISVCGGM